MNIESVSFMSEKLPSKKFENDDSNLNTEDNDYKNLITKLKDIRNTIFLLEKTTSI